MWNVRNFPVPRLTSRENIRGGWAGTDRIAPPHGFDGAYDRNGCPVDGQASEGTAMNGSLRWRLVLPFFVFLCIPFFSASVASEGPIPQGKAYSTITFYVA